MTITEPKPQLATESGHYYDARTGEAVYTVVGKNGKVRNTTLRDARDPKRPLVPSVTEILKCAHKPALDQWKQKQILLAALTLPRIDGETDEAFAERVIEDSQAQAKAARERGTALHGAIERYIQGKDVDPQWQRHVEAVGQALHNAGIDILSGQAEKSFAHPLGFGGKVDLAEEGFVVDFKNKPSIPDPSKSMAFEEHASQLSAYALGLYYPKARLLNCFVGCEDAVVVLHEWTKDEQIRAEGMFLALLKYWQIKSRL